QKALGKKSQYYQEILKSTARGEKYWFSPPFKLYQGTNGFIFYIPLRNKGKLSGWIAPVISSNLLFKHFKESNFFNNYELVIKDKLSGNIYFETGLPPKSGEIREVSSPLWGREIIFQSWSKATSPKFSLPFSSRFIICFIVSFLSTFFM